MSEIDGADTRLAEARFWLAAITESSDDAIIGKNLDGIVTSWNKAAETMFGYTAAEIVGQSITLIVPPDRLPEEADILARIRNGEGILHIVTERQDKSGAIRAVTSTISTIRDDSCRVIGICETARDLTEMQRIHRDLERREALLSAILDTAPDALVVIDPRGVIQSFSTAASATFGYTAAEMIGRNVSALMPAPYRQEHDGYLSRYVATRERHIIGLGRVVVGQRKNGDLFPMELSVGEVNLPGTQLFAGFVRDLTERQTTERRINELQTELLHVARVTDLGQMVSALAHEVNQPLTAISSYLGGIRRLLVAGNQEAAQQAIERVLEQAARARQIIQRIRDHVSKRETPRQIENVAKTIEEAVALIMVGLGQGLKLEIAVAEDASEAFIDKVQIQQVLLNLIRNAIESMATSPKRELSITARRVGDMVEISVADTGSGLSEAVRAKLFQPFVTSKADGMGVGLSVCRTIVDTHGGEVRAENGVSGGTIFRFTIPHAATAA